MVRSRARAARFRKRIAGRVKVALPGPPGSVLWFRIEDVEVLEEQPSEA